MVLRFWLRSGHWGAGVERRRRGEKCAEQSRSVTSRANGQTEAPRKLCAGPAVTSVRAGRQRRTQRNQRSPRWRPERTLVTAASDSKHFSPPRKPFCNCSVRFERRERNPPKTPFAMDQNALVVAEIAELVRLDFVFLGFVVIYVAPASTVTP